MAPISTEPVAPQATHRFHGTSGNLKGDKQLVVYVAAIAILVLVFGFTGVFLLHLRRRLRQIEGFNLNATANTVDVEGQDNDKNIEVDVCLHVTINDHAAKGLAEKTVDFETPKPPVRSTTDPRPSSLSEMEAERARFLSFKFPPVQDRDDSNSRVAPAAPHSAPEIEKTRDTPIAVQSADRVRPPAFESYPIKSASPRKRDDADRGERTLKRLEAVIALEPTFVVPEVTFSRWPIASSSDSRRHGRVMDMLEDILAQEPPPLSPDSNSSAFNSPDLATPASATNARDSNNIPPIDPAQLQQLCDEPRTVVLVEASPCLTQRYLVHPVLNTWSKLTGRGDIPLISHPAIIVQDTSTDALPMQGASDIALFDAQTSPDIEYLTPSWGIPDADDEWEEDVEEDEAIDGPPPQAPSQLRGATPRPIGIYWAEPGNALGIFDILKAASDEEEDLNTEAGVPPQTPFKMASPYGYF